MKSFLFCCVLFSLSLRRKEKKRQSKIFEQNTVHFVLVLYCTVVDIQNTRCQHLRSLTKKVKETQTKRWQDVERSQIECQTYEKLQLIRNSFAMTRITLYTFCTHIVHTLYTYTEDEFWLRTGCCCFLWWLFNSMVGCLLYSSPIPLHCCS